MSRERGYTPFPRASSAKDEQGALAEIAFAKLCKIPDFVPDIDSFKGADCRLPLKNGSVMDWQIRSTNLVRGGLIVRPGDACNSEKPFALMVGEDEVWELKGWQKGREARE